MHTSILCGKTATTDVHSKTEIIIRLDQVFIPTKEFKENSLLISDHHQDISAKYSSEDLLKVAVLDQMIFLQKHIN
jgi:deoxyhypusine synthase